MPPHGPLTHKQSCALLTLPLWPVRVFRPLIWVECLVERPSRSRTDYVVKARSQFKERSVATNVEIILPLPSDATAPVTRCSQVGATASKHWCTKFQLLQLSAALLAAAAAWWHAQQSVAVMVKQSCDELTLARCAWEWFYPIRFARMVFIHSITTTDCRQYHAGDINSHCVRVVGVLQGSASYAPEKSALVWHMRNFPGGKEYMLR